MIGYLFNSSMENEEEENWVVFGFDFDFIISLLNLATKYQKKMSHTTNIKIIYVIGSVRCTAYNHPIKLNQSFSFFLVFIFGFNRKNEQKK